MTKTLSLSIIILILVCQMAFAASEPAPNITVDSSTEVVTPVTGLDKAEAKLRKFFTPIYNYLEIFRVKEAEHFAIVRDKTKVRLGIDITSDALENIKPFLSPPPAPSILPGDDATEDLVVRKIDNPKDYAALIGSTALASLFASIWMFYIALILLIFFFLRMIFKMIV